MKKLLLLLTASFLTITVMGQEVKTKKDSIYFKGAYHYPTDPDYKAIKIEYDKINFETSFMPGLSFAYYLPKETDSTGNFMGLAIEYLLYASIFQNDNPGPSHVRLYSKFNMLNSDRKGISDLFLYSVGISLSIEKNPKRIWVVPYFGLEFGGMSQKKWGTTAQFTPTLGLHIISKKNIFVNAQGGYIYPVTKFDLLQGWYFQGGINFALW